MRIGMLLETTFPSHQRVEKEMRSLTAAGHEVHLMAYGAPGAAQREHLPGIGTVHRCEFPGWLRRFRLLYVGHTLYAHYWARRIRAFVRACAPDVLHAHDLPLAEAALRGAPGLPLVADFHENWPGFIDWVFQGYPRWIGRLADRGGWSRSERRVTARAQRLIVVDPTNGERLRQLYGVDAARLVEVSNTPDLPLLDQLLAAAANDSSNGSANGSSTDSVRLLYMGGIDRGRGLHTVVDALAEPSFAARDVRLELVGDGPYRPALEAQVQRLQLGARVTFAGWQPYRALPSFLRRAHVGIVPHVKDPLTQTTIPNKIFEYMAGRIPVLASDCTPMVRVLNETKSGVWFASENVDDCRRALRQLVDDAAMRERMGAAGRHWVESKYRWSVTERALLDLYADLQRQLPNAAPPATRERSR